MSKQLEDQVGKKYNRLTVIEFAGCKGQWNKRYWNCICDCGKSACVEQSQLRGGKTKSCGCLDKDRSSRLKPISERFWSKVNIPEDKTKCWEWTAGLLGSGREYGVMSLPGSKRAHLASRVAWTLKHGEIPNGMFVCHKCDNPKCVNVDHLFLGTHKNNMEDMVRKGKQAFGARLSNQTEESAKNIIALYHAGMDKHILGRIFGMKPKSIWDIVAGVNWTRLKTLTMLKKTGPLHKRTGSLNA